VIAVMATYYYLNGYQVAYSDLYDEVFYRFYNWVYHPEISNCVGCPSTPEVEWHYDLVWTWDRSAGCMSYPPFGKRTPEQLLYYLENYVPNYVSGTLTWEDFYVGTATVIGTYHSGYGCYDIEEYTTPGYWDYGRMKWQEYVS
jgi:hypothetical protein